MDQTDAARTAAEWYRSSYNIAGTIDAQAAPRANNDGSRQVVVRTAHAAATVKVYPNGQVILVANAASRS